MTEHVKDFGSRRLTGKVAFVSGGLRGIGLACVERFLAEGAEVVLSDLDNAESETATKTISELGDKAHYVQANVAKEEDWQHARDVVQQRHGKLHILVNNAGTDLNGPVETLSLENWRRLMAVNVDGVFLGVKTFVPLLAESGKSVKGGASIINVSSIMGMVGFNEVSAYNASKGAVRMFTKGIAIEFTKKQMPIRANSLHPGFVSTPLLHSGFQRWVDSGFAEKKEHLIDAVSAATPMGRLAEPSELASGVYFLASDDSAYMTGAELVIDGGWTAQ
jgi:NAD(P)-dependent dehydrogenase (short-subunit alcohol dehydrogenase family)